MALGAIAGSLLSGVATAGASTLASKLFGKNKNPGDSIAAFKPAGFSAGGLTSSYDPTSGNVTLTPSGERLGFVRGVADNFNEFGDLLSGLRSRVAPGASELRARRLAAIDDAETQAIGNLRDNLSRRRVLGSSFGQDAANRASVEFARARDTIEAESFMQELGLTSEFAAQEYQAKRSAFQTQLDELNLQADLASKLASGASSQMGENARLMARLDAAESQGAGKFFGQAFQPFGKAVGGAVESAFSGGFNPLAGAFSFG